MLDLLSRRWWWILVRGIAAILFGIVAFTRPGLTLWALVMLFAAYAIAKDALPDYTHRFSPKKLTQPQLLA